MKLTVTLPLPPSTNTVYRRAKQGRMFMTTEGVRFKQVASLKIALGAQLQLAGNTFHEGQRFALRLKLHFPDRRRCDIDNRVKLVQDALGDALGFDDRQIWSLTVERGEADKLRPRCELTLTEFVEGV